ncbi:hypothetical protein [Lactobacillus sp. CBA3605] [Lactiplantibacillus mudanjiangensis]|uniref:DUF1351 domain-containing protein n=1 Tax=Lactiplantibacillus mudanjiangensis TaxID=1296538 RepID=UPI0010141A1B|nr:DUF1351 domain-containing protein [Lactiplantibacillus mudanjiangensis]VDG31496.1 hypothetical protein [Lactobacillus sp. CBA3605] [Lactiplantibacillus mudanjiangensis]
MDQSLINLPDYSVEYTPAPIVIKNADGLEAAIAQYVARYQDMVVTSDTEADTKKVRAELRKLKAALDDRRKEIKRGYNQPLREFEAKVKSLEASIDMIIDPITVGLNELEVQRRDQKKQEVSDLIAEMAPNYGVEVGSIDIDPRWLNKSASHKQVVDEIGVTMTTIKAVADKLADDIAMITRYANVQNVDPLPWIDQLNQGQDVQYLLSAIDNQVAQAKERQHQRDLQAQADAEHQTETKTGKVVDTDTGEVVDHTTTLKITGSIGQLTALKGYMDSIGVKYEKVAGE